MRSRALLGLALSFSLTACVTDDPGLEELGSSEEDIEIIDVGDLPDILPLCPSVAADAIHYVGPGYAVPPSALPFTSKSANGGYGYKGCGRYVVDFKIG